jgi:hypothetical protein
MPKIINKIIKTLITSDFFLNLGWGFLAPVFAIFILQKIAVNDISEAARIAGFAALSYWITKSLFEIPIAVFLDKHDGEKDDFWFMAIGIFIMGFVPIGYIFASTAWHIYLLQMVHAIAMAMALPSWMAIFTRHITKGREAFNWSVETTTIGTAAGIAGGLGGIMAGTFGFASVFILVSVFTFISGFLYLFIKNDVLQKDGKILMTTEKPVIEP